MPAAQPFDFTEAMRALCEDVVARLPEFDHISMEQIAVTFAQTRNQVSYGLQAKLTPLRFEGGQLYTQRRGRTWTIQRWYAGDVEMLYILTFYLPRFLEQTFREKLITVVHELYHISPRFDGDIRRLPGHYHVHSRSQKEYDEAMDVLVDRYLASRPPESLFRFLKANFRELTVRHGSVVGIRVPIPKLLPLSKTA
jgi:Putative phage metallopeptidase